MKFVSLHGHTSFSTGDGHGSPQEHVDRVKELGMKAMAITEHGSVSSHVQIEQATKKAGIKPIFGLEAYVANPGSKPKFHQTILAMNQQGYVNLNRLVTNSYIKKDNGEGFYMKPTVNLDSLFDKKKTEGLIILSGCASSMLACTIAGGKGLGEELTKEEIEKGAHWSNFAQAMELVDMYQETFGDRFYLEVQRFHDYHKTVAVNQVLERIWEKTQIPMVATADVHYPRFEDWDANQLANAIGWNTTVEALENGARKYDSKPGQTYPTSDKEMAKDLMKAGVSKRNAVQSVLNTKEVAKRCNVELPKTDPVRFSESDGTDEQAQKLLKQAIKDGIRYRCETDPRFKKRFKTRRKDYAQRIKKELKTILPKGFSDYFLINKQIIGWAKDNGIVVGPGRGSAAGSVICYLLRLTEVDPIEFPEMVFERFLDPGREDDPDIDTDYQDDRRNEVFDFARSVYGEANVGNIGNFSRYRGKSAVKAAAKALKIPASAANDFSEYISEAPFGDPREFLTAYDAEEAFPEAKEIADKYPSLRRAYKLEGDMRTLGIHAAGMVLSNRPISDTCAIYSKEKTNGDRAEVIAYDKRDAAYLKMLKLDCLGLSTMTIVSDVLEMLDGKLTLEELYALPRNDEKVLKGFAEDKLTGIFQFEGRATRTIVKQIFSNTNKIPTFMQLADMNALSRPGSLSSGMTAQYVRVERGEEPKSIHPLVDEILADSNGCLVYQEQVMKIGQAVGGLDDHEIGRLRKIIGAKQAGGAFDEFWKKFRDGAAEKHGMDEAMAREIWDYMAASASYLFNVAHAICYALVAYWTMYLKVYYPAEFYAACLRNAAKKGKTKGKADPQLIILQEAVKEGLSIYPPRPTLSRVSWWPNTKRTGVQAGFMQIPKVGPKVAERMNNIREENFSKVDPWVTWDFYVDKKIGFGAKAAKTARELEAKSDPFDIGLTSDAVATVLEAINNGETGLDMPDATAETIPSQSGETVTYVGHVITVKRIDVIGEMRKRDNLTTEEVLEKLKHPEKATKAKIICTDQTGGEVHVNISRFDYPKLKSEIDEIDEDKTFVIHTIGNASSDFGPAIQGSTLTTIELES